MSNVLSPCLFELSQSYKLNICYKTHLLLPHYLSLLCDKHPDTDTELLQHNPGLLSALGTQHAALQQQICGANSFVEMFQPKQSERSHMILCCCCIVYGVFVCVNMFIVYGVSAQQN